MPCELPQRQRPAPARYPGDPFAERVGRAQAVCPRDDGAQRQRVAGPVGDGTGVSRLLRRLVETAEQFKGQPTLAVASAVHFSRLAQKVCARSAISTADRLGQLPDLGSMALRLGKLAPGNDRCATGDLSMPGFLLLFVDCEPPARLRKWGWKSCRGYFARESAARIRRTDVRASTMMSGQAATVMWVLLRSLSLALAPTGTSRTVFPP